MRNVVLFRLLPALFTACTLAHAAPQAAWASLRTEHFEICSQVPDESLLRRAMAWFEELHTFFDTQTGLKTKRQMPTRVIGFSSERDYEPYRLGPSAHAYYIGTESRDYIVLPSLGPAEFQAAAHEYAHLLLRNSAQKWPLWLSEGLAEFYSTIHIGKTGTTVGGDIVAHSRILNRKTWIPLSQLTAMTHRELWDSSKRGDVFYAESWALTDMLLFSPGYAAAFRQFVTAFDAEPSSAAVLERIYGKTIEVVQHDLALWVRQRPDTQMRMPPVGISSGTGELRALSSFESRSILADLLVAGGELDRARLLYSELAQEQPDNGNVHAALGSIALRRKDYGMARDQWRRALANGVQDPDLCFRYANLADSIDLPVDEIRQALNRAIALRPDFDEARYKLAVLESNAGRFEAAIAEFRAMRQVAHERQFPYWSALSYALTETEDRSGALEAAEEATKHAANDAERSQAASLAYISQTELAVQFAKDSEGRLRLTTTRRPRTTTDWNPFIQPDDRMRVVEGSLSEIACSGGSATALIVEGGTTREAGVNRLRLSIVNPRQIQVLHAPGEFICGPQAKPSTVSVQYAQARDGQTIVRGIDFR